MLDPRPARPSPYLADARALAAAAAAIRSGSGDRRATCEIRFTSLPIHYGFLLVAGVTESMLALEREPPRVEELDALRTLNLVDEAFVERLAGGPLRVDVDAAPDGTLVFAREPVVTLEGRLSDVLIAASVVRAHLVRATAVCTRAARRVLAANGSPVIDGSAATLLDSINTELVVRAAYIGGIAATTATLAGARLGIQVRGIPLDELADLVKARVSVPDGWGAPERVIDLGGEADEITILALRQRLQPSGGYVVHDLDAPALLSSRIDLVALEKNGAWSPRLGSLVDISVDPGRKLVVRYVDARETPVADVLHLASERIQPARTALITGVADVSHPLPIEATRGVPLTTAVMRAGRRVGAVESLTEVRNRATAALASLPDPLLFLHHPQRYPVGLSPGLAAQKAELIAAYSQGPQGGPLR